MSDELTSAAPPSGGIEWKEHLGKLLVVEPTASETGIPTVHGASDAVRANVHVITGVGTAEDYDDVLIFPRVLQSQLRGKIGQKVVGRLSQGQAKAGQSAPWIIDAATDADLDKARQWLAARNAATLTGVASSSSTGSQPPF